MQRAALSGTAPSLGPEHTLTSLSGMAPSLGPEHTLTSL